jgi:hypothetical protein
MAWKRFWRVEVDLGNEGSDWREEEEWWRRGWEE